MSQFVRGVYATSLSEVALSCLLTKGITSQRDKRQAIPEKPSVPDVHVRRLCAQLIIEETMELVNALGFHVSVPPPGMVHTMKSTEEISIEDVVDQCCDLEYVSTGTLCAFGVADLNHKMEVIQANEAKFPNAEAVIDPQTGKYLKPPGWSPPNHGYYLERQKINLNKVSQALISELKSNNDTAEGK